MRGLGDLTLVRMFAARGVSKKARGVLKKAKGVPKQPKAKEEPPKLFYLCNFPGCSFKSIHTHEVRSHFQSVHGKNKTECLLCGNGVDDHHPCCTFMSSCPKDKDITWRELEKLRVRVAMDQQKKLAEEQHQKKLAEQQKKKLAGQQKKKLVEQQKKLSKK